MSLPLQQPHSTPNDAHQAHYRDIATIFARWDILVRYGEIVVEVDGSPSLTLRLSSPVAGACFQATIADETIGATVLLEVDRRAETVQALHFHRATLDTSNALDSDNLLREWTLELLSKGYGGPASLELRHVQS